MRKSEKAELISIICSIFMAAAMIIAARLTGSVGVLAEGIDTVMDVVASLAVLAGMKLSERRTSSFPQGLYKLENIVAVSLGVLIIISAYELARESIGRMSGPYQPVTQPWLVSAVMGCVVIITAALAWYKNKVGKEENSPSLQADAKHSWTDVLASAAVAGGVLLQEAGIPHMDSVAALIVVAALFWSGLQVTRDGLRVLLDASIEKEIIDQIREYAEGTPGIREVSRVTGRNSGSYRFVELSVVPISTDLREAEKAVEDLKKTVRDRIEHVDRIDVEFSVAPDNSVVTAVPLAADRNSLSEDFGGAPFFAIFEVATPERKITREEILPNPAREKSDGRDIATAVFLANQEATTVLFRGSSPSEGATYVLEANGISLVRPGEEAAGIDGVRKGLEEWWASSNLSSSSM
jgi:cation diffusion facilitator family transporter